MLFFAVSLVTLSYYAGKWNESFVTVFLLVVININIFHRSFEKLKVKYEFQEKVKASMKDDKAFSTQWLNTLFNRFWVTFVPMVVDIVVESVNPILATLKPPGVSSMKITKFELGKSSPVISNVIVYHRTLPNQIKMDLNIYFKAKDMKMVMTSVFGVVPAPLEVGEFFFEGAVRLDILLTATFPHADRVRVSFLTKPKIDFSVKPLIPLDIMDLPGFKKYLVDFIIDTVTDMFMEPKALELDLSTILARSSPFAASQPARGVLVFNIKSAKDIKIMDTLTRSSDPFIRISNGIEIVRTKTHKRTRDPQFHETLRIFVRDIEGGAITLELLDDNNLKTAGTIYREQLILTDLCSEVTENFVPVKVSMPVGELDYSYKFIPLPFFKFPDDDGLNIAGSKIQIDLIEDETNVEQQIQEQEQQQKEQEEQQRYLLEAASETMKSSLTVVGDENTSPNSTISVGASGIDVSAVLEQGQNDPLGLESPTADSILTATSLPTGLDLGMQESSTTVSDRKESVVLTLGASEFPTTDYISFGDNGKQGILRMHIIQCQELVAECTLVPYVVVLINNVKMFKTHSLVGKMPFFDKFCELLINNAQNVLVSFKVKSDVVGFNETIGEASFHLSSIFLPQDGSRLTKDNLQIIGKVFKLRGLRGSGFLKLSLWYEPLNMCPDIMSPKEEALQLYEQNKLIKKLAKTSLIDQSLFQKGIRPGYIIITIHKARKLAAVDTLGLSNSSY